MRWNAEKNIADIVWRKLRVLFIVPRELYFIYLGLILREWLSSQESINPICIFGGMFCDEI